MLRRLRRGRNHGAAGLLLRAPESATRAYEHAPGCRRQPSGPDCGATGKCPPARLRSHPGELEPWKVVPSLERSWEPGLPGVPARINRAGSGGAKGFVRPKLEHAELSSAGEETGTQRLGHPLPQPFAKPPPGPGTRCEVQDSRVNGREHLCAFAEPKSPQLPLLGHSSERGAQLSLILLSRSRRPKVNRLPQGQTLAGFISRPGFFPPHLLFLSGLYWECHTPHSWTKLCPQVSAGAGKPVPS